MTAILNSYFHFVQDPRQQIPGRLPTEMKSTSLGLLATTCQRLPTIDTLRHLPHHCTDVDGPWCNTQLPSHSAAVTRLGSGVSTPLAALESLHSARMAQQEIQFQQAKAAVVVQEMQLQQAKLIQQQESKYQRAKIAENRELQITVAQQQREIQVKIAQSQQQQELQFKAAHHAQRQQQELQMKIQQELHAKAVAAHELQVKVAQHEALAQMHQPLASCPAYSPVGSVSHPLSPPIPTTVRPSPPMGGLPQLSPNTMPPAHLHGQYTTKKMSPPPALEAGRSLVECAEPDSSASCCLSGFGYASRNCTDRYF